MSRESPWKWFSSRLSIKDIGGMNCPLRLDFSVIQVRDGLLQGESQNKEVTVFNCLSGSSYRERHYLMRKRGRGKRKIYFLCGKTMQKGMWVGQHYL